MRSLTTALAIALCAATTAAVAQTAAAAPPHNSTIPSTGCQYTSTTLPLGQSVAQTIVTSGQTRQYLIHLPTTYQPGQGKPLVLAFHGRKGDGHDIEAYSEIDALDTIAVYPIGAKGEDDERAWQGAPYAAPVDDVQFVRDLLDSVQATLCVDPYRIYAVGKSNGGGFVSLLACKLPQRIAAFGVVAGAFYPGTLSACGNPTAPVPIIDFHGTADSVIAYNGDSSNHGQPLPTVMSWAQSWANRSSCSPTPATAQLSSEVVGFAWGSCLPHKEVLHFKIVTGDHTWPGAPVSSGPGKTTQQIKATTAIWSFLTSHPLIP
ncbi:alpha/beta hydrolase family esterase [Actinokineospora globicatena]|uniref:alpha/beta hydrolase family esterase n=1 Tax=Actinokineospora globicatena TaxID=103729 RepID=UPI0020A43EF4|nr:PHB depolymerase family esterase [Actinokineospora globicatena]MCP2304837.1 polyhydroxybutyrate depolymerase [Actinokineospora globicatena]GLW77785.1 esterase [Actinokineospora globicatena]GLW85547.1 esterase [Actinokineospora globicatena]